MPERVNKWTLVGKHGLPDHLERAMREEGMNPDAIRIESAEGWQYGGGIDMSTDEAFEGSLRLFAPERPLRVTEETWPAGLSDGLTLPCSDCGEVPRFDYHVDDQFWNQHVPEKPARLGVVCLPCLDRRCGGEGLAATLRFIQWTGTGHTVVLTPTEAYTYG